MWLLNWVNGSGKALFVISLGTLRPLAPTMGLNCFYEGKSSGSKWVRLLQRYSKMFPRLWALYACKTSWFLVYLSLSKVTAIYRLPSPGGGSGVLNSRSIIFCLFCLTIAVPRYLCYCAHLAKIIVNSFLKHLPIQPLRISPCWATFWQRIICKAVIIHQACLSLVKAHYPQFF